MGFYFCSLYCLQNLGQLFSKNHLLFSTEPTSIWCRVGCCTSHPSTLLSFFLCSGYYNPALLQVCLLWYVRIRVAALSIFRLPESGLVRKNRESSPNSWTTGAFNPAMQTPSTTAAICLSEHLANSKLFKDFYGLCSVCTPRFLPLPSALLQVCLAAPGPVHAGNLYHINSCSYSTEPQGEHGCVVWGTLYYGHGYSCLEEQSFKSF